MKILQLFLVVVVSIGCAKSNLFLSGEAVQQRTGRILTPTEVCLANDNNLKRYCNGADNNPCDSNGFIQCNGIGNGITIECSGNLPACEEDEAGNAQCVAGRTSDCSDQFANFNCMGSGVFPDPLNCKRYFYCYDSGNGLRAQEFQCPEYYVFDPSGTNGNYCRLTGNRYCVTASCPANGVVRNYVLVYRFFPTSMGQIVVRCLGGTQAPLVFRCEEGFVADLNSLPIKCNVNCVGPAKYVYPEDETKYYECIYTRPRYEPVVQSCFRGEVFNPNTKRCEASLITDAPTTPAPVTNAPTTPAPVTNAPTTPAPVTNAPTTPAPVTNAPTTPAPVTNAPTTPAPVTNAPTTPAPVTNAPTTPAPVTNAPTTPGPVTDGPATPAPVTDGPTTPGPVTDGPTTPGPVTDGPTTPGPVTDGPATPAPPGGSDCATRCSTNAFVSKCTSECVCDEQCSSEAVCTADCVVERECSSACSGNADSIKCANECKTYLDNCSASCTEEGDPTATCELTCAETECYYTCVGLTTDPEIEACANACDQLVLGLYR